MTAPLWLFAAACLIAAALIVLGCCRMAAAQDEDSETWAQLLGIKGDDE
jgi:hypothetical protein